MATWREVEQAAPDLARAVRERFAVRKHATMATLRRDGSPRISGTEVEFTGDDVVIGFRLDVTEVVLTCVEGNQLEVTSWHEGRGVTVRRRD